MQSSDFFFKSAFIRSKLFPIDSRERISFTNDNFILSAVNFLILPHENRPYELVLIKRVKNFKDKHSGEMAFPGGMKDPEDKDLKETALRETEEELGIPRENLHVLGSFDDHVTPSRYIITPIVTYIEENQIMKKNDEEVHEIVKIPITFFANKKNYRERKYKLNEDMIGVGKYNYKSKNNKKYVIFGATCHMIVHFIDLVYNFGLKASEVRRLTPKDLLNNEFLSMFNMKKNKYQDNY
ncbi:MAG: NUDIX hydrolase [Promethearchaeota archaeon]